MIKRIINNKSVYTIKEIDGKLIVIFEYHNMALPIWSAYSHSINSSCQLITFDSHSDTRTPFTTFLSKNGEMIDKNYSKKLCVYLILKDKHFKINDYNFEDVFNIVQDYVKHDEHIKTAYDWNYLSKYIVITNDEYYSDNENDDLNENYSCKYFEKNEWKNSLVLSDNSSPIILDFDLDFFTCQEDIDDIKCSILNNIIKESKIITIAREHKCFDNCKTNKSDLSFTNDFVLDELLKIIEVSLT